MFERLAVVAASKSMDSLALCDLSSIEAKRFMAWGLLRVSLITRDSGSR